MARKPAVSKQRCPPGYRRGCSCHKLAAEPSEDCHVHGWPDGRFCPHCGQLVSWRPCSACKRCGWVRPGTLAEAVAWEGRRAEREREVSDGA